MARSLWLDTSPHRSPEAALAVSATRAAAGTPSWVLGVVRATDREEPGLPAGWVRVGIPHDAPTSEVTGLSDGGLTAVGAVVAVTLDSMGRVVSISSPITIPEGVQPVATGAMGQMLQDAMTDAAKAFQEAEAVAGRAQEAFDKAEEAASGMEAARQSVADAVARLGTLEGAVGDLPGKVAAAEKTAADAQAASDAAAKAAAEARAAATTEAAKALEDAKANTKAQLEEWANEVGPGLQTIWENANDAKTTAHAAASDAATAMTRAQEAAQAAVDAKNAADKATADMLGVKATADAAMGRATTAGGLYTVAAVNPSVSDGEGKPTGAIWEVRSGGTSLRRYVWGGSTWQQIKAGAAFIADKAIGRAQIGDAAVGTAQVADASITDAKIGNLSVSKLVVTGGARIPVAVINALMADQAFISSLLAKRVVIAGDPTNKVGAVNIEDGAVTAAKIYASEELWAKIAAFGSVDTDMLTAGNATIAGTAVVGDLIGNRLSGGELSLLDSGGDSLTETVPLDPAQSDDGAGWRGVDGATLSLVDGSLVLNAPPSQGQFGATYKTLPGQGQFGATYKTPPGPALNQGADIEVTLDAAVVAGADVTYSVLVSYETSDDGRGAVVSPPVRSGTAKVPAPDGARILALIVSARASGGTARPALRVDSVRVSWRPLRTSGLRIWRDSTGQARIDVTTGDGQATLTSEGLTYTQAGARLGQVTWSTLVQPPAAIIEWADGAGQNTPSGQNGLLPVNIAAKRRLWGGCTTSGTWLILPKAGWYQVEATCAFLWSSTQQDWAVSVGVRRSTMSDVDWNHDAPAMTLPLIPGVTTRPVATGLMHCAAGEGLCLAYWQNTGAWRPNAGPSRLSVRLINED